MTAVTSANKKSFFGTHFRNKIIENKKLLIINSILELIGLPVIAILGLFEVYANYNNYIYFINIDAIMIVSWIAVGISIFLGLIIPTFSFRYLYTKSLTDMNYALPLTTKQRFSADYLSGLLVYIVPPAAAAILSLIIVAIGGIFLDVHEFWEEFGNVLLVGLIVYIGMILLYTLCVFAIVCCGSTLECGFSEILINLVIPGAIACTFYAIYSSVHFGLDGESLFYSPIFTSTSPVGNVIFLIEYIDEFMDSNLAAITYIRWIVPEFVVIAAFIIFTYILYKKRNAEDVSKPYVFRGFYYVIITLLIFCILSLVILTESGIVAGIIGCAIVYFLIETVSKRGFKKFYMAILRFVATVAAVFIFCNVCSSTNGFGAGKYVPRVSSIESVGIDLSDSRYGDIYDSIVFKDKDVIQATTQMQKNLINLKYSNFEGVTTTGSTLPNEQDGIILQETSSIGIKYYMKNGSTVVRNYYISSDMIADLITKIYLSEEYADYLSNNLASTIITKGSSSDYHYDEDFDQIPYTLNGSMSVYNKLLTNIGTKSLSYNDVDEIRKAYREDILAMTEDDLKNSAVLGYIESSFYPVRETYTNTIALLDKYCNFTEKSEISLESLKSSYSDMEVNVINNITLLNSLTVCYNSFYYESSSYAIQHSMTAITSYADYCNIDVPYVYTSNNKIDSDFIELLNRSTSIIIGEKPCSVIIRWYEGCVMMLYVPDSEENRELAEKVRSKIENQLTYGYFYNNDYGYDDDDYYYYDDDDVYYD